MKRTSKVVCTFLALMTSFSLLASDLKVGEQAPNFKLQATNGDYYQLSDYQGKQAVF
jgi:peroxiredoxin Q/BCP